jgi:hypothetical protein
MQSKNTKFYPVSMEYIDTDNYAMFAPLKNFKKIENFNTTTAPANSFLNSEFKNNKVLLGLFQYCGLNARIGCLSSRNEVWTNQLEISDWDLNEREIKTVLPKLKEFKDKGTPVILEFADLNGVVQASFYYTNSYGNSGIDNRGYQPKLPEHQNVPMTDVKSYEFQMNEPNQVIYQAGPSPIYQDKYIVYFYPKYIIETPPEPIPSGKILLQLVQEGELQIIDFGRQICVQNTGAFFPAKAPNNPRGTELPSGYSISGKGIDRGTTVIGYNCGPSTPLGIYKDCLILTLSKPINILLADGNFYVPPPPNTPAPPTEKPGETPGPPTPGPTPYSILNPRNVPTSAALITQPPGSSNFVIAVFEAIALFFANLFKR